MACNAAPKDTRPSFLLVVFDTLRKDAVSAYGMVEGSTPNLDGLARSGLLYSLAFAPSPWTLPSHATLFTGLPVEQHGVRNGGQISLPVELVTLAERLHRAGYETAGFSENPIVGREFKLSQGFEHYAYQTIAETIAKRLGSEIPAFDVVERVALWLKARPADRPFFVFVNLFDAHDPFTVREDNPFLPAGVDATQANVAQPFTEGAAGIASAIGICDRIPPRADIEILKGLYLGEVAAADAKAGAIRDLLATAASGRDLVTIATSDHGEHLGERRLLGHEFSVGNVLLNVPLIVHGLPDVMPGVRDEPVELGDVVPSVLHWAGIEIPPDLPGRLLPTSPEASTGERSIIGIYVDEPISIPNGTLPGGLEVPENPSPGRRRSCGPADRVFGTTIALTRYPHKLIWFENHPSELYDLSWDPRERSDRATYQPEFVASLERELAEVRRRLEGAGKEGGTVPAPSPAAVEVLRGLGYVE